MHAALTIELEEWFHGQVALGRDCPRQPLQAAEATRPLLDLLKRHGKRATFFVVGEVARECPALIETVAGQGHEVGCHGMTHRMLPDLGPERFKRELEDCLAAFRRVLGPGFQPAGFRAPLFSLSHRTPWAVPLLVDAGYRYDASIFPARTPLYGAPSAPTQPYRPSHEDPERPTRDGRLVEFPMSLLGMGRLRVPAGGGGVFFRTLPLPLFRFFLERAPEPAVFYIHPWETYAATPHVHGLPWWHNRLRHHGYRSALGKLDRLLADPRFQWAPMGELLDERGHLLPSGEALA